MTDLIIRLSKLDAPDREVDAEIAVAIDLFETQPNKGWPDRLDYGRREENGSVTWPGHGFDQLVPPYTASVDAAIALAERVLPNERVWINRIAFDSNHQWRASLTDNHVSWGINPAIALCITILRAKEASKL